MALVQTFAQGRTFEDRIKEHFYRGICELTSVVNDLHRAKEDAHFYMELKEHIEEAAKELGMTEKLALQALERVDSMTSEMMVSKKKLMEEQKTKENALANLQTLQKDLKIRSERQREDYRQQTARKEQAEKIKAAAEDDILEQEKRINNGLKLMLIPVVGTVVGGIKALKAHAAQKKAEEEADAAQELIEDYREKEWKAFCEVGKCEKQLKEQEDEIKATQKSLEAMEDKKKKLASFHKEILNLQEGLRSCSHLVGTLNTESNVVKVTSQYVFIYDSLKRQIDSIMQHVLPFLHVGNTEHQLLDSPKIKRSIRKLKFFCESPSTVARNMYVLGDLLYDENFSWYFLIGFVTLVFLWATGFFYKALLVIVICFIVFSCLSL